MALKPKLALYWCASCGGCEETVVDLEQNFLTVVAAVDIVFWPYALDYKYSDVESMDDGSIDVALLNGAIRTSEQEHIAKLLRKKTKMVIAFGSCACTGGVPALANLKNKKAIFKRSYLDSPTVLNMQKTVPLEKSQSDGIECTLPEFYDTVYKLDDVIDVDYYIPGCPPTAKVLLNSVHAILKGELPEKGAVLLSDKSLCTSCNRNESKPENLKLDKIHRIHEIKADPEKCFLAQGVLCMGPATRDGCEYPCVKGNMPCTGCFGPMSNTDQGARMIAALGGTLKTDDDSAAAAHIDGIVDPAGTFYRYSLSSFPLGSNRKERSTNDK
jgi:F420-non-reducing hydrogenase small subunit